MSTKPTQLVEQAVPVLRRYLTDPHTADLRELAELIIQLRSAHTLEDGRTDWGGRSPAYRQSMTDLYHRAAVPADKADTIQAAIRYHVGSLLRERTKGEELAAVGLSPIAPRQRLATRRQVLQAQAASAAPRQDVARLTAMAQALLEHIDAEAVPELPPERAVASRLALEAIDLRVSQLLRLLAPARGRQAVRA